MPVSMKGTPFASSATVRWRPGGFDHTPLPPYNKFSADGGGGSSWPVIDGTLGTFCPAQSVVNERFGAQLRDLGKYGVSSKVTAKAPPWKTAIQAQTRRLPPKRNRPGIAGDDLGPAFVL